MCQILRYVFEMRDPNREHDPPRPDLFAIVQPQEKSVRRSLDLDNHLVFEFRHHPIFEGEPVIAEGGKPHWYAAVCVFDTALRAKVFQSELAIRIVDVRSETVGFEHHAFRHVREPAIHRPAKNAEWDAATPEMC